MSYVAASSPRLHRTNGRRADRAPALPPAVLSHPVLSHPVLPDLDILELDTQEGSVGQEIDLRQLRHHTKNTLQRIIALIAETPGLHDTPAGERIAQELQYRIGLSADISNALFGLTSAPGSGHPSRCVGARPLSDGTARGGVAQRARTARQCGEAWHEGPAKRTDFRTAGQRPPPDDADRVG